MISKKKLILILFVLTIVVSNAISAEVESTLIFETFQGVDINFVVTFSVAEYTRYSGISEAKMRNYLCDIISKTYPVSYCYVRVIPSSRRVMVRIYVDDITYFIILKDIDNRGKLRALFNYKPVFIELFPDININWREQIKYLGTEFFEIHGSSGDKIEVSYGIQIDNSIIDIAVNSGTAELIPGKYIKISVDTISEESPDMCVFYLTRGNKIYQSGISQRCASFFLTPDYNWDAGNDYILKVFAIKELPGKRYALSFKKRSFSVRAVSTDLIALSRITSESGVSNPSVIHQNEFFYINIESPYLDASCTIKIIDSAEQTIYENTGSCDMSLPIDTTEYSLSNYVINIQAQSSLGASETSHTFSLIKNHLEEVEGNLTDKTVYIAGDDIVVMLKGMVEGMCQAKIVDLFGNIVAHTYSLKPCERFVLGTAETIREGNYTLVVDIFLGDNYIGKRERKITILTPKEDSVYQLFCKNGRFEIDNNLYMPCLIPGMNCNPVYGEFPECLCAADNSRFFLCEMGALCTETGCTSGNPVIIDNTASGCRIKVGIYQEPCLFPGEICARASCTCFNNEKKPQDVCSYAQVCENSGCDETIFHGSVISFYPGHLRKNEFRNGYNFRFSVKLRFKDMILKSQEKDRISAMISILDIESPWVEPIYWRDGIWNFTVRLSGLLKPDRYTMFISIKYDQHIWRFPQDFEIWYLPEDEYLETKITNPPESFDYQELRNGYPLTLYIQVTKRGVPVVDLPSPAFSFYLGGKKMTTSFAKYDSERGLWAVGVVFRFRNPEVLNNNEELITKISYLGQYSESRNMVRIVERRATAIKIIGIEPEPYIFQAETVLGFNLALDLKIYGFQQEDFQNMRVVLTNYYATDEGENIIYGYEDLVITSSIMGIKVYISNIRFCDPPILMPKIIPLQVYVEGKPETMAQINLYIKENPGRFYIYNCENKEKAIFADIKEESFENNKILLESKNTGTEPWPDRTYLRLIVYRGIDIKPVLVFEDMLGDIEPYETKESVFLIEPPLSPGWYIYSAKIVYEADDNVLVGGLRVAEKTLD